MSAGQKKKLWVTILLCTSGLVFQFMPSGCVDYYARAAVTAVDFCSIFNCEGGQYVDLCGTFPMLFDCPNIDI